MPRSVKIRGRERNWLKCIFCWVICRILIMNGITVVLFLSASEQKLTFGVSWFFFWHAWTKILAFYENNILRNWLFLVWSSLVLVWLCLTFGWLPLTLVWSCLTFGWLSLTLVWSSLTFGWLSFTLVWSHLTFGWLWLTLVWSCLTFG